MFVDVHTHKLSSKDEKILSIYNVDNFEEYNFFCSYGIHPWEVENEKLAQRIKISKGASLNLESEILDFRIQNLREFLSNNNCLAIGEIGLDKLKGANYNLQIEVFRQQLKINEEFNLPVIIHSVKSLEELLKIKSEFPKIDSWIIHGCRKGPEVAATLIKHGFYLSFGAALLNEKSKSREALKSVPLDRVFFETDDSALNISDIYKKASEVLELEIEELERIIFNNFKIVFKKYNG